MTVNAVGALRHCFDIRRSIPHQGPSGEPMASWRTVANAWGAVKPVSGREYLVGGKVVADVSHEVTVRHMPEITPKTRLVTGGRVFEVVQAINQDERSQWMSLACKEVV